MSKSPVDLSYYIKKKLSLPLMLHGFMEESDFTRMLEQHRLVGSLSDTLETFEREGWLQPAFRLHKEILPDGSLNVDPYGLQQLYRNGNIEFPQAGDYKPWNSFKPKSYKPGEQYTAIYYHKYQLLQVKNILNKKQHSILLCDSYTKSDIVKIVDNIQTNIAQWGDLLNPSQTETTKVVGMLMLLEEHYVRPSSVPLGLNLDRANNLVQEMWNNFSARDILKDTKFSTKDVRHIRDGIITDAEFLDPLRDWYDLIRIMQRSHIDKIKGTAYTAQLYYVIAHMLTIFINDLEGVNTDASYVPFGDDYTKWRKQLYRVSTLDYNAQKTRKAIIEYYTRGATTRSYLLVEGDSEEKVINEIVKRKKLPFFHDYAEIFNCHGAKNMTSQKIQHLIQAARKDSFSVYLIGDNENAWSHHIESMQDKLRSNFGFTIWNTSFEEDNFGRDHVIKFINSRLQKNGKPVISDGEIKQRQQNEKGLVSAIAKVYADKHGKTEKRSLFQTIGINKSDLALELLDDAYNRGVQDELKIMKIIQDASRMIRIWPL